VIISEIIKEKRAEQQLTQEELSENIFVSRKTISNWETGKTTPDLESLIRLSELFNLSLDELIKGDKKMIKNMNSKMKKGEYFTFIAFILVFLIGLPSIHKLFYNDFTASLLFFGYILIILLLAALLILWGLKGLVKYIK